MSKNRLFPALMIVTLGFSACVRQNDEIVQHTPTKSVPIVSETKKTLPVPAFQSEESVKNLDPTLSPDIFTGSAKAAYKAVKEIPEVIAQMPCFCRCDRALGHKSLHTCFKDDHGANCGICTNSALKAYKLHKEKKLTPKQIREELIAEYDKQ